MNLTARQSEATVLSRSEAYLIRREAMDVYLGAKIMTVHGGHIVQIEVPGKLGRDNAMRYYRCEEE